jgi:hypothetical protein
MGAIFFAVLASKDRSPQRPWATMADGRGLRRRHAHLRRRAQGQGRHRPRDREETDHQDRKQRRQKPRGRLVVPALGTGCASADEKTGSPSRHVMWTSGTDTRLVAQPSVPTGSRSGGPGRR